MKNRSICVYCGSSSGNNPVYNETASKLGLLMATNNIDLVYGGASIGVMGALADSVLHNGGNVYGIIPRQLVDREVAHAGLTKLFITNSMHERKALMANLCDGFVALPGGFGTYEELFEAITWNQLNMHSKPIMLLNTNGYFLPFIDLIEHGINEGFIRQSNRTLFEVFDKPDGLIGHFFKSTTSPDDHWL